MHYSIKIGLLLTVAALVFSACKADRENRVVVVDPGHFHASLLFKEQLKGISDTIKIYAPQGPELEQYLKALETYNGREEHPTHWIPSVCACDAYLDSLPQAGKGDILVTAGNNLHKIDYISEGIRKGYNVLADKPMAIDSEGYQLLEEAYSEAERKGLVLYDMMTERFDDLNVAVRKILSMKKMFGKPESVDIMDVHHFYKEVSGTPLIRPAWYYDVRQQGEGLVDVTTHFIDLVMWWCFPDYPLSREDLSPVEGSHYPTVLEAAMFEKSTGCPAWPEYLSGNVFDGRLSVMSNGDMHFRIKDLPVHIGVRWDYEGSPDSFSARIILSGAMVEIIQDESTGYVRNLYVSIPGKNYEEVSCIVAQAMPEQQIVDAGEGRCLIDIPVSSRSTHEDHFGKVLEQFREYVRKASVPEWERDNTMMKYYITTQARQAANAAR